MRKPWTERDLLIAMNLYCRLPFGQFHRGNKLIQAVAESMGRTPSSVAMKLSNLASLDAYHQGRGVKGLRGASQMDRKVWAGFHTDWTGMAAQSEAAMVALMGEGGDPQPEIIGTKPEVGGQSPTGPTEIEAIRTVRRVQSFFRRTVVASYDSACALTGIREPRLLVASHIISWAKNEARRADPTNGICLNALHDQAFDRHLITFDEDWRLVVSPVLLAGEVPEFQAASFSRLEGTPLRRPHRFEPDAGAMAQHRAELVL
ncbi:MAG: HNH endonuclease [Kiritimatiellae bacterium]|nr:HNH endonuclease [Kiritimatiellia bacterium]